MAHVAHPPDRALARAITEVLREARNRGMTTRDLADYFGVSDPTISRWEAGGRQPALDLLPRFDELAGRERGYVLRRAGYVTDDGVTFEIDRDNPDEMAIWTMDRVPEWYKIQTIEQLRQIQPPPPPPRKQQRRPTKARGRKAG